MHLRSASCLAITVALSACGATQPRPLAVVASPEPPPVASPSVQPRPHAVNIVDPQAAAALSTRLGPAR
jgi:hypothetical protein